MTQQDIGESMVATSSVNEGHRPTTAVSTGLALSGGGIRAAVFHLGVLRCLAEHGVMERVTHLSTASGGSLIVAAIVTTSGMRWPTSPLYLESIYPALRQLLTTRDLFSLGALGVRGVIRQNIRLLNRRANILVDLLRQQWKISGRLNDLPETPVWWINATCLETGKNWRFSKREMGDWQFGRHYEPPFSLAQAVTGSAAVPYAIGTLRFELPQAGWYATDPATRKPLHGIKPPLDAVHLWDGGAYENLGLESLYKAGQGLVDCDFLICSDASGPLSTVRRRSHLGNILRGQLPSPHLFSISSDQIRALRSRMFVGALRRGDFQGVLLRMGNSTRNLDLKSGRAASPEDYDSALSEDDVAAAANHPTDLGALPITAFDRIARHGYEVAERTLTAYSPKYFK
jgi:NTE family protein